MFKFIKYVTLQESTEPKDLTQTTLPYKKDELEPALSEDAVKYHYSKLYKAYVDRYNEGEGDPEFNEAGAYLHDLYFTQFYAPKTSNLPTGKALEIIEEKFGTFDKFKEEFLKEAMGVQGSGWVYLSRYGEIKTIKNHVIRKDITVILDMWEHAFISDYTTAEKMKYVEAFLININWSVPENYFLNAR